MDDVDCVVVGAGVVGLAVARAFAMAGRDVLLLDAADGIGTETSSRNSEVIHAGIYYAHGSLMARLCVAGKRALYAYCEQRGIGHARCGKLIVASDDEEATRLDAIRARASGNGVDDLRLLSGAEARDMEPNLACVAALHSPSTGIIDSHGYMLALQGDAEAAGTVVALRSAVAAGRALADGVALDVDGTTLRARLVVNAAGLGAVKLARAIEGMPHALVPTAYLAKGSYFSLSGRSPFSRLIYPVPVPGGLGVHLTIDLGGSARFGPDVEWVETLDYAVDPHRADRFYDAVRKYWPGLPAGALQPGYAGIRPKIVPPGAPGQDFMIQGPREHGVAGLINLFGIESPGLTSSLALADEVVAVHDRCS